MPVPSVVESAVSTLVLLVTPEPIEVDYMPVTLNTEGLPLGKKKITWLTQVHLLPKHGPPILWQRTKQDVSGHPILRIKSPHYCSFETFYCSWFGPMVMWKSYVSYRLLFTQHALHFLVNWCRVPQTMDTISLLPTFYQCCSVLPILEEPAETKGH